MLRIPEDQAEFELAVVVSVVGRLTGMKSVRVPSRLSIHRARWDQHYGEQHLGLGLTRHSCLRIYSAHRSSSTEVQARPARPVGRCDRSSCSSRPTRHVPAVPAVRATPWPNEKKEWQ
jgi:hypothetical protein